MPKYKFLCKECNSINDKDMPIEEYTNWKRGTTDKVNCSCGSKHIVRIFKNTYSNIEKDLETIKQDMKDEIKMSVDRFRSGDQRYIDDICGSEINSFKT
jgi:hypothetical protein